MFHISFDIACVLKRKQSHLTNTKFRSGTRAENILNEQIHNYKNKGRIFRININNNWRSMFYLCVESVTGVKLAVQRLVKIGFCLYKTG